MVSAIKRAVIAAGSQSELARLLKITPQAVQQWVSTGRVSHKKVIEVEKHTGVKRQDLRPDLYPVEKKRA